MGQSEQDLLRQDEHGSFSTPRRINRKADVSTFRSILDQEYLVGEKYRISAFKNKYAPWSPKDLNEDETLEGFRKAVKDVKSYEMKVDIWDR